MFRSVMKIAKSLTAVCGLMVLWCVDALATGTGLPYEQVLQTGQNSLSGPVATTIGIASIVGTGAGFALSEGGSGMKKVFGATCATACVLSAPTLLTSLFSSTGGCLF